MKVTIEAADGLERRLRVVVPSGDIDARVDQKIKTTSHTIKIKGFRPGKAPPREVHRRYGKEIRQDIAAQVIQSSFDEAVIEQQLSPAGMPRIEEVINEAGRNLEFLAIFEVFPEVKLASFRGVAVKRQVSQVEDADIDKMIEILRQQRAEYVAVDRPCALADRVNFDFERIVEGEAYAGSKPQELVLGSGHVPPGFEEGLIGIRGGEKKTITVDFSETSHNDEQAVKDAIFNITMHRVAEPRLPELNAAFYQLFDVTDGSLETFRTEIRANMERELDNVTRKKLKERVLDGLCKNNKFDLPSALVEREMNQLREAALQRFAPGQANIGPETISAEVFKDEATRRLKVGLLLTAIAKKHELQADPARLEERITTEASAYEHPAEVINYIKGNEQELSRMRNLVLEDQIIDLVLKSAKVKPVKVDYETAVKPDDEAEQPDRSLLESARAFLTRTVHKKS